MKEVLIVVAIVAFVVGGAFIAGKISDHYASRELNYPTFPADGVIAVQPDGQQFLIKHSGGDRFVIVYLPKDESAK